jgi:hypothetical protein
MQKVTDSYPHSCVLADVVIFCLHSAIYML